METRYHKRVNLGDGFGLNLSKSGVSSSYRTKYGTIGAKGFSIRTGIPGLTFRTRFGKKNKDAALIMFFFFLTIGLLILSLIVAWNIILFFIWLIKEGYILFLREKFKSDLKKEIIKEQNSDDYIFMKITENIIPKNGDKKTVKISEILVSQGKRIRKGEKLITISNGLENRVIKSETKGNIYFYKREGEKLKFDEYLFKIQNIKTKPI